MGMPKRGSQTNLHAWSRQWSPRAARREELETIPIDALAKGGHPTSENTGTTSGVPDNFPNSASERSCFLMHNTAAALRDMMEVLRTLGGKLLVVSEPKSSDLILVLSGEPRIRVYQAFRLLREGWSPRIVITTDANWQIFTRSETQLAEEFVCSLPPELRTATYVVPVAADSTLEEAAEIGKYMNSVGAHSALLVTSDYHTRRALSVFRRLLPEKQFGICGAPDPAQFGMCWWRRRTWAKRALNEAIRLAWWLLIDRWRLKPMTP